MSIESIFEPESIAVIGAARERGKIGHIVLQNLISSGFEGPLYPVNPKADEILGLRCYESVLDIEGDVDLVIFVVRANLVPMLLEEAGEKGVNAAIIITAGFKEIGSKGAELERQVVEVSKRYGIRVLGPNCLGVINTFHNMNSTFTSNYPGQGPLAIISQSGAICTTILDWNQDIDVGFSRFVSVGNKADIDEGDLIEYIGSDDETRVIGLYIEGGGEGKEFMEKSAEVSRNKAIVTMKSGRSSSGARAASSHTGNLSGSDDVWEAAMEQAGIIRAKDMDELFDYCLAFSKLPLPEGEGVTVVTNAGGLGVMSADACSDNGIPLNKLENETVERLAEGLPEEATPYNPVDIVGDADVERVRFAIETILQDKNVNCLAAIFGPNDVIDLEGIAELLAEFRETTDVPILASFIGGKQVRSGVKTLHRLGIPNYDIPDRAMRAVAALIRHKKRRDSPQEREEVEVKGDSERVREILEEVRTEGRIDLTEIESKEVLSSYGIPVPEGGMATNEQEAVSIAENIGYPVVMKIVSPDILHKTEVGGVEVGIQSERELRSKYELVNQRARTMMSDARIKGVMIQKQVEGREVLVGMVRNAQFGPVMTFGIGGIFVEVMKDVSRRIAPLDEKDVDDMVSSIKAYPLLSGARGSKPADLESLKETIRRMSQISLDFPEIAEMETNPVIVGEEGQGCWAVDALISLENS